MASYQSRFLLLSCILWGVGLLLSCAPMPKPSVAPPAMIPLPIKDYPRFEDSGGFLRLDNSIARSLDYLKKLPGDRKMAFGPDRYTVAHLIDSLAAFRRLIASSPSTQALNQAIRDNYRVYRAAGRDLTKDILFTGYYEPLLTGSRNESATYPVPVHGRPADLVEIDLSLFAPDLEGRRIQGRYTNGRVIPYPTRAEIRHMDHFNTLAPPVVWLKDEVDLVNLHIQGSGKVQLSDGDILQIQFDSSNGRPYRSIGRWLIDQGCIAPRDMSMPAIRTYLRQHPDKTAAILDQNPRYIFFRRANSGPNGALGVALTPMRSIAVDRGLFPSAALAFFVTQFPRVNDQGIIERWEPYHSFALAQDSGSAITGPGRVDLFVGAGREAEVAAGHLKHPGLLHFLVLKAESAGR